MTKPTDEQRKPKNPLVESKPGPGIAEPTPIGPVPADPSRGITAHPALEPIEGPTEASDNKDDLTPIEPDSSRVDAPNLRVAP